MIDRRSFFTVLPIILLFPSVTMANPLAWMFRGILRSSFRSLSRSGGRYAMRTVSNSISRTSSSISRPSQMVKTFGKRTHTIRNRDGKIVGSAKIEGDVLMIRDVQKRILGSDVTPKK